MTITRKSPLTGITRTKEIDVTIEQTPSLPDARPRSDRFRCGGRESNFLAAIMLKRLVLAVTVCLCAFGAAKAEDNPAVTRDNLKSLVLSNVQGLWGGRKLYLTKSGLVIQVVTPPTEGGRGLQEKRYEAKLADKDLDKLIELLNGHKFFQIKIKERFGVPDESRPAITLTLATGETKALAKWGNDKHEDFDPIYIWLLDLAKNSTKDAKPVFEGRLDYAWRPAGFEIKK